MEEVQQRIQTLELHQSGAMPSLPPLYAKQQPRNVRQLAIDAFHIALDDFPETVDKFELKAYQTSLGPDGNITRFKARWVVRGFEQQYGVDFTETFASVVRQKTYRVLFALAAVHDWEIEQMDVKTAFLYGDINEEVYVELPTGYGQPGKVCKLRKALYGLKLAPRIWYLTLQKALQELGFSKSAYDKAVFSEGQHHPSGLCGRPPTIWSLQGKHKQGKTATEPTF
jgi:hypothetical protein